MFRTVFPKPDQVQPKPPPKLDKVVLCRPQHQRLLGFMGESTVYWCPGEDVELPRLLLLYRGLEIVQNSEVVPKAVLWISFLVLANSSNDPAFFTITFGVRE